MWHYVTLCDIMWHSEVFRCIQSYSTCCTSQKDLHSPTCFRTSWLLQELVSKKPWKGEQCGNHGWRCWWIEYKPWCWANLVGLVGGWWNIGPSGFNVAWMLQEAGFLMVLQFYNVLHVFTISTYSLSLHVQDVTQWFPCLGWLWDGIGVTWSNME